MFKKICFGIITLITAMFIFTTNAQAATEIIVNKTTQTLVCWDNETKEVHLVCPISTGTYSGSTPEGIFATSDYYPEWHKLYYNCWAYGAIRINGHILLHSTPYTSADLNTLDLVEYAKLGTPASHGCIRMSTENILFLTQFTTPGTRVVVTQ